MINSTTGIYLDGVVADFATGIYVVTRGSPPTFVNGVAVPGSVVTIPITACVQPLEGIDLMRLPEGQRSDDYRVLYTAVQLNTTESTQIADTVVIDGDAFQIMQCERFQELGNYFRARAQRIGRVGTNS